MAPVPAPRHRIGLVRLTAGIALFTGGVLLIAALAIQRQQTDIENKAQRIFDVAMPLVFEATRMIRSLERLARDGESILWIEDAAERSRRRQRLQSIVDDAALQDDLAHRTLVAQSVAALDQSLAALDTQGSAARASALQRWQPLQQALINASEGVAAQVSTAASDEADSIAITAQTAGHFVVLAGIVLALMTVLLSCLLYWAVTRPVVRLAQSLKDVRAGLPLQTDTVYIRELQVLQDAAADLACAHRELETARSQLEHLAHTDALTGLANRRMLEFRGQQAFERSRRYGEALAVMAFDLDHFKNINDRYGHEGGDAVLRALGSYLLSTSRNADLPPARAGGEEFALLLPHATLDTAREAAERIRQGIAQLETTMPGGELAHITASFGVASCESDDADIHAALHRADLALYQAKQSGRNRVVMAGESPKLAA